MRRYVQSVIATAIMLTATSFAGAQELNSTTLRRRELAQERAQAMARDLVTSILDIQLRQFEENGLAKMPVYVEIKTMRDNVDGLVGSEMQAVVELLVQAQEGDQPTRLQHFNAARDQIREVVLALMAERQRLYRRLQIAKLAAQVRELIAIEEKTRDHTLGLLDQPMQQRESIALGVIQDQRDVAGLFVRLVHDLGEVTQWGGKVGAGAADGIRILKAAQTGIHLDTADQNLSTGLYSEASEEQTEVIKGLKRLLEKLEETRGLISSDRDAARKLIDEITKKQEELRETTKETDLKQLTPDALTEKQEEIRDDLGQLAQQLEEFEPLQPLLEQSKAAAHDAVAKLFEGDQAEALADQDEVLGALAELAHQLESAAPKDDGDKSADELAAEVKKLEKLQEKLAETAKKQDAAEETAAKDPAAAQQQEASVAEELARLADDASPTPVESRLLDAQEAAAEAAEALQAAQQDASPEAQQTAQAAMQQASEAIEKAEAETAAQLADLKRKQLAVEVGELARAAEALERAAAAERDIAAEAQAAAVMPAEEVSAAAAELAKTQQQVGKVADDVATGLENTAPQVAEMLKKSNPAIATAAKELASAAEQKNAEKAASQLNSAADAAQSAGESLKQAAAELRKAAGQTAQKLAEMTGQQLAQTTAAKDAVKQSLDNAPSSDTLQQLQAAQQKIAAAQMEQMKAAGKTDAAAAQQLAQEISKLAQMQQQANAAAAELNQGKANSPVAASAQQQQVADEAQMLGEQTDGALAEALQNAEQAAATAAQETLSGDPNKAAAAREEAAAQLASAQRKAEQMATEMAAEPAGQPDPTAQAKAADLAAEAAQLAGDAAPQAAAAAQHAADAGKAAAKDLAQGEPEGAAQSQAAADKSLGEAAQELAGAIDQAAQQMTKELAKQAPQLDQLAQQAGAVDPNAASALRQAEQASQEGAERNSPQAQSPADSPASGEMQQAADSAQRSMQQAAAALTAREQQLTRDKSIAEALAALAEQQQHARDEIDRQADALAESMPSPPMGEQAAGQTPPVSPAAAAAAQQLANASRQFAETQTATGEGAQQISGQQEVANQPLRAGLEAASQLPLPQQSLAPAPPASELAMGETGPETSSSGESPGGEANQPSSNNQQLGQPAQGQGPGEQTAASDPAAGMPGQGQDLGATTSELGTGLVPNSPQTTADAIAGGQAVQQALQAMPTPSQGAMPGQGDLPGQVAGAPRPGAGDGPTAQAPAPSVANAPTPGQQPQPGATSSVAAAGGTSQGGQETQNQDAPDMPLSLSPEAQGGESNGTKTAGDSDAKARRFDNEPWFAKLPPGLQKAIQAGARREPPRGYEQRLRRYFENVD